MKIKDIEDMVLEKNKNKFMRDCDDPILLSTHGIRNPVETSPDYILFSAKISGICFILYLIGVFFGWW